MALVSKNTPSRVPFSSLSGVIAPTPFIVQLLQDLRRPCKSLNELSLYAAFPRHMPYFKFPKLLGASLFSPNPPVSSVLLRTPFSLPAFQRGRTIGRSALFFIGILPEMHTRVDTFHCVFIVGIVIAARSPSLRAAQKPPYERHTVV